MSKSDFPEFDPAEFLEYVKDEDLSDAQAHALLREMWNIVVGIVSIRFNMHPVQAALDKSNLDEETATPKATSVVSSKDQFSTTAKRRTGPCRRRRARSRRDS